MGIINIAQQLSALSVIFLYNNVSYVLTFFYHRLPHRCIHYPHVYAFCHQLFY